MEIFKDIPGFEGQYQVSNYGNVKSLSRLMNLKKGFRISNEKILKACIDSTGYYSLNLNSKSYKVHALVAITFLNHIPCGYKKVVDHIDNNKLNNNLSNLQIVTNRFNVSKKQVIKTSKYTGVCFDKERNKWVTHIKINGKTKKIGRFTNEIDAAIAYQTHLKTICND